MDEERFRKELEARTAAHDGDVLAAVSEMLGEVVESVESLPNGLREIVEAGELEGLRSEQDREVSPRDDPRRRDQPREHPDAE